MRVSNSSSVIMSRRGSYSALSPGFCLFGQIRAAREGHFLPIYSVNSEDPVGSMTNSWRDSGGEMWLTPSSQSPNWLYQHKPNGSRNSRPLFSHWEVLGHCCYGNHTCSHMWLGEGWSVPAPSAEKHRQTRQSWHTRSLPFPCPGPPALPRQSW